MKSAKRTYGRLYLSTLHPETSNEPVVAMQWLFCCETINHLRHDKITPSDTLH